MNQQAIQLYQFCWNPKGDSLRYLTKLNIIFLIKDNLAEPVECVDHLPFCSRLAGYCSLSHSTDILETGLAIESYNEYHQVQRRFEKYANLAPQQDVHQSRPPIGCEEQYSAFQKFQILVEVSCPKTCLRCVNRSGIIFILRFNFSWTKRKTNNEFGADGKLRLNIYY